MKLHYLMEGQIVARLDWRNLPDLDDLALEVLVRLASDCDTSHLIDDMRIEDAPTRIAYGSEARVDWRRTSPCWCGEHGWHMDTLTSAENDRPGRAFMAVEWL